MSAALERVPDPIDDGQDDDFLAYWNAQPKRQVETKRILGVVIPVPHDVPLKFTEELHELKNSTDPEDTKYLLQTLFGSNPLEQWTANGATAEQLTVILAWAMANAQGRKMDFAEAHEVVVKAQAAEAEGKAPPAPNRKDRRASSATGVSASTGRASSRTSVANTASARRKSRTSA